MFLHGRNGLKLSGLLDQAGAARELLTLTSSPGQTFKKAREGQRQDGRKKRRALDALSTYTVTASQ